MMRQGRLSVGGQEVLAASHELVRKATPAAAECRVPGGRAAALESESEVRNRASPANFQSTAYTERSRYISESAGGVLGPPSRSHLYQS